MASTSSKSQINKDFIYILKFVAESNKVELERFPLRKFFVKELAIIEKMCNEDSSNLLDIASYINETPVLNALNKKFQYCEEFHDSYQEGVEGQSDKMPMALIYKNNFLLQEQLVSPSRTELNDEIQWVKNKLLENYNLWINAYCLQETNKFLDKNPTVLAFSHRRIGWSKRPHQLTVDFSVQIATNFGYGRSSYFFSKLTYKQIDLIPFSEWVNYRYANFFEIARYTGKYDLQNECWQQAMEFCRDACNMSLFDEKQFIETYIISECEKMVEGLEVFLSRNPFVLKDFQIGENERTLIEFRGEKISGAIDFIDKILLFKEVFAVDILVQRIFECNRQIQPILTKELATITAELKVMNQNLEILKSVYLPLEEKNQKYNKNREALKRKMMLQYRVKEEGLDKGKLEAAFLIENPEYSEFLLHFAPINNKYIKLLGNINATTRTQAAITSYEDKIISYLSNKN